MDEKKTTSKPLAVLLLRSTKVLGVLAVAITVLGGFDAILANRLKLGQSIGESQVSVQLAEAKGYITKLEVKSESQVDEISRLQDENRKKQRRLSFQSKQLASLGNSAGGTNNCAFVHQQIQETKQEIDNWVSTSLSFSKAETEEKADKAILERRLRGYQQQLGTCQL